LAVHGTAVAVAHALRFLALAAIGYLAIMVVLAVAARRPGATTARRWLHGAPRSGRLLAERLAGTGLVASAGLALLPSAAVATAPVETGVGADEKTEVETETETGVGADEKTETETETETETGTEEDVAVMVPLGRERSTDSDERRRSSGENDSIADPPLPTSTTTSAAVRSPPSDEGPAAAPTSPAPAEPTVAVMRSLDGAPRVPPATDSPTAHQPVPDGAASDRWRVELGDHLWSIAAEVVAEHEPAPDDRAIASYWERLVAANRTRLVDPDDPDLLFPGQELVLPAVTP
jgi:hypothetical protein